MSRWTDEEEKKLEEIHDKYTVKEIAKILNKSEASID